MKLFQSPLDGSALIHKTLTMWKEESELELKVVMDLERSNGLCGPGFDQYCMHWRNASSRNATDVTSTPTGTKSVYNCTFKEEDSSISQGWIWLYSPDIAQSQVTLFYRHSSDRQYFCSSSWFYCFLILDNLFWGHWSHDWYIITLTDQMTGTS